MDFSILDMSILGLYTIGIFLLAYWSTKKNSAPISPTESSAPNITDTSVDDTEISEKVQRQQLEEQFLAGRSLTFLESISSIIATEVSALTFLGIPAFAFDKDCSFVQIYIGAIFGRLLIALYFLPAVYGKGLTIYEVMAEYGQQISGRITVASVYSISKILSVGVRLFSGCILVSQFLGISIYSGIALVSALTFAYTLIGGLKAVVRTDIAQMLLFLAGGALAHYLIPIITEDSWTHMMQVALESNKLRIVDTHNPAPFILGIMGGFLFDMSTHGVDQDFAQRITASKSLKQGQLAIFISAFASIAVGLLFLGVGALLYVHYQAIPLPNTIANSDQIFADFIIRHFPSGVRGFMVAGVLAATMSTLDSTINALSATLHNDIWPSTTSNRNTLYTGIITLLLCAVALVASNSNQLLLLGLKIQSWTGGSLLALFLGTVLWKEYFSFKFNWFTVLFAYAVGCTAIAINTFVLQWDWNFNVYLGFGGSIVALYVCSVWEDNKENLRLFQKYKNIFIIGVFSLCMASILGIALYYKAQPSNKRDWISAQEKLPTATIHTNTISIEHIRDFQYNSDGKEIERYTNDIYDLNDLETVDMFVSHFAQWEGAAHIFLSFGFNTGRTPPYEPSKLEDIQLPNDIVGAPYDERYVQRPTPHKRYLVVSVEARREKGENYSPFLGVLKQRRCLSISHRCISRKNSNVVPFYDCKKRKITKKTRILRYF
jgi:Na+/proline symporter